MGGPDRHHAAAAFAAEGFEVGREAQDADADVMIPVAGAADLLEFDRLGRRYLLVHVGSDDGEPQGTYARAHERVSVSDLPDVARRSRSRERTLVRLVAFGYKLGVPAADWVIDTRFLLNPYWVPELRELSGLDEPVRRYVLGQPAAAALLDGLEPVLRQALPLYGRPTVTIAFGCTGGRHRSVCLAAELARRLEGMEGADVEMVARDL